MSYLVELVKDCKSKHVVMEEKELSSFFNTIRPDEPLPIGLWRLTPYRGPEKMYLSFLRNKQGVPIWHIEDQYRNWELCA